MKDLGMKDSFSGQIELISGEINLILLYYLAQSEQIKSVIACSIKMNDDNTIAKAIGFMHNYYQNIRMKILII